MRPEFELKERLRLVRISMLEVCDRVKCHYGTLSSWLNGYAPLPDSARREILNMIEERQAKPEKAPA